MKRSNSPSSTSRPYNQSRRQAQAQISKTARTSTNLRRSTNKRVERNRPEGSKFQSFIKAHKLQIATSLICALILVAIGVAWAFVDKINNNLHAGLNGDLDKVLVQTNITQEPFYMLLMGTDKSKERNADPENGGSFRSDSLILARIDAPNKKVSLISLHRDTLMDMGKHGRNKLNAAYAIGGPSYAIQTVSQLAQVPLSHYAEINFDGFKDVVDALGGVEVDVPMNINDKDAGGSLKKGKQVLNGSQALILCRARHAYDDLGDGDVYRAANQRLVLAAITKKILASDPATMAKTIETLSRYITTDLQLSEIVSLAQAMHGMDPSQDISSSMEPTVSHFVKGDGWYEFCDEKPWRALINRANKGLPLEPDSRISQEEQ